MYSQIWGVETGTKVLKIALILVAVTIPLHNNFNSWAIVFLCTATVIESIARRRNFRFPSVVYVGLAYFLWLSLTFFWDTSGGFTIKNLEGYAGLAVFPLIFWLLPSLSVKAIWQICFAFIISVTVVALICLVRSFLEYRQTGDSRVFYYHYLSQQMQLNAIFLSNYCVTGICWLIYFRFVRKPPMPMPGKLWVITWCIALFVFVFMLSSKLVIFLLLAFLIFLLVYIGKTMRQFKLALLVLILVMSSAALAVDNLYYFRWRLAVTEFKEYEGEQDNQNGLAARMLMWRSTAELVKEKPLAGYGLRGAGRELFKKFEEKKFWLGIKEKYNSHNQYLQTALMAGIVGLGLLIAYIGLIVARGFRSGNILLVLFSLHFICISMVESTFEVQQELIFFFFFMLLFYFHLPRRPNPNL
jgi:O-antigen ligase